VGVELVGLVDVSHQFLGHLGVRQARQAAGLLDLVDDPVPVAHRFQGDGGSFREAGEIGPDGAWFMIDPGPVDGPAAMIENGEERIVLAQP